jgi:hypothetical protein
MEMDRAESVYVCILLGICALLLWAGAVDLDLYYRGHRTISTFLRSNQEWFLWPLVVTQVFLALLTVHLYLSGK